MLIDLKAFRQLYNDVVCLDLALTSDARKHIGSENWNRAGNSQSPVKPLLLHTAGQQPPRWSLLKPIWSCSSTVSSSLLVSVNMVSQRQRFARKRYKEAHPELFTKPEHTPPKDPDKKKKKSKSKFKRKRSDYKEPKDPNGPNKKGFKKHPLRVPGMKPGESCFICKAKDHIAKLCPQKAEWEKNKVCVR